MTVVGNGDVVTQANLNLLGQRKHLLGEYFKGLDSKLLQQERASILLSFRFFMTIKILDHAVRYSGLHNNLCRRTRHEPHVLAFEHANVGKNGCTVSKSRRRLALSIYRDNSGWKGRCD